MTKDKWLLTLIIGCIVLGLANIVLAITFGHWFSWLIGGLATAWGMAYFTLRGIE